MSAETLLTEMPSLSKLYVNAAATAAKGRLLRSEPVLALPSRAVEVRGVRADLAKVTEFSHLMGEAARDVLPSGYLHALVFPVAMSVMVQEDFPLPLLGMIHLRNQVEHLAPVMFTDELSVRAWARDLTGHRSGTQVQIVAEIHNADGTELLWRGASTYLAKGVFLPGLDKPTEAAIREDFIPPAPTAQWRLGVDTGRAYAAVSGDFNPIHLSVLSARALGLRRSIAHGMYAASRVLATVPQSKPEHFSWDIAFDSPVFLPATVSLEVVDSRTDDGVWLSSVFTAWNARAARRYFHGSVSAGGSILAGGGTRQEGKQV
ncbi:MaoC/PaaZ C-terminal domain-containing protein [Arthrobacter sp. H35-D1]|uniref:MaoC family dehydratase n=1 Tax=Arthrobacter sp. H35-D1 TaxID=3046202 RepID=UPI0024B96417|nr:MaoC/PaaZ C-terminal domain-containing protein [Arthrobacter sp. H35-D1]MDJ0314712.1 MaoC/PaaZ C-terminal domain-containing protein [Arthrobacter sp. H35-D1]